MGLGAEGPVKKTLLINTINDFATTLNHWGQIDAVFLDMSKAFDTVPIVDCAIN